MGRFESPLQVAGLFLCAAFVSVGLIFFINAEAHSRQSRLENRHPPSSSDTDIPPVSTSGANNNGTTFLNYLESRMERMVRAVKKSTSRWFTWNEDSRSASNEKTSEGGHNRLRRSADGKLSSSGYYWNNGLLDEDRAPLVLPAADYDTDSTKGHNGDSHPSPKSSSSNFHRIRHAVKKLGGGGLDLSVVERMILDSNPVPEANSRRESLPKIADENYKHNIHLRRLEQISREESQRKAHGIFYNDNEPSPAKPTELPSLPVASSSFLSEVHRFHGEPSRNSQTGENEKNHFNRNHHYNFNEAEADDDYKDNDKRLSSTSRTATNKKNTVAFSFTTDNSSDDDLPDRDQHHNGAPIPKNTHKKSIHVETLDSICYKTDDVLVVVGITCCLNFAFVLVVWGCVRWFSIANTSKEKDFQQFDCEDAGDSILFRAEHEDRCWSSGNTAARDREFLKHRIKRFGRTMNSTSLYTFRPDYVPQHCIQRSYSHSMEDLRYIHT